MQFICSFTKISDYINTFFSWRVGLNLSSDNGYSYTYFSSGYSWPLKTIPPGDRCSSTATLTFSLDTICLWGPLHLETGVVGVIVTDQVLCQAEINDWRHQSYDLIDDNTRFLTHQKFQNIIIFLTISYVWDCNRTFCNVCRQNDLEINVIMSLMLFYRSLYTTEFALNSQFSKT